MTTLRDRYAETAAVVGVEYVEKVDMAQQNNNAEWEEKILELAAAEQTIKKFKECMKRVRVQINQATAWETEEQESASSAGRS